MLGLPEEIDTAIAEAVKDLRARGYSWAEIGSRLGITRQAAQQRWGMSRQPDQTAGVSALQPSKIAVLGPGGQKGIRVDLQARLQTAFSAHDTHSSAPGGRPGSTAPPVNGSQVRDTVFCPAHALGYVAEQVDELCRRVAAELDAGGSARPLIENAAFRTRKVGRRYDIDAVDWFLDQFLLPPVDIGRTGVGDDTWDDLPVTQVAQATGEKDAFRMQCDRAWHDFGQQPGTRLWFGNAARWVNELRTADQQTLVSVQESTWFLYPRTFIAGGRSFTFRRTSAEQSSSPAVTELRARAARVAAGQFTDDLAARVSQPKPIIGPHARRLADGTGTPILYAAASGDSIRRAGAYIMFPDQQWLRFLVRGSALENAIMTAVDQAGNRVARYRYTGPKRQAENSSWGSEEIIVHPGRELTDGLALALALSANGWLTGYFHSGP